MKPLWIVIALACCAASFFLGRATSGSADGDASGAAESASQPGERAPELATATGRIAQAERALEAERASHAETKAALDEAREELASGAGAGAGTGPAADGPSAPEKGSKGPRYEFPAVTGVLPDADWRATGTALAKMSPLLAEFAESLAAGKGIPSSIGELQRWNAPLLTMALEAQRKGVAGTGIPGTFSNVALAVNMMHAALAQSDTPLDEGQTQQLGEIARRFVAEDERRLAAYDESTYQLEKEIAEADLKDRFYTEALALMTPAQQELLHPTPVRGRLGLDLFSSAVLWNGLCGPIKYQTPDDLRKSLAGTVMQRAKIPAESREVVDQAVAEWVSGFPPEYLAAEPDGLQKAGLDLPGNTGITVERVRVAAAHELRFLRALHDRLPAGSDVAKRLRGVPLVAVPVLVEPE